MLIVKSLNKTEKYHEESEGKKFKFDHGEVAIISILVNIFMVLCVSLCVCICMPS